MENRIDYRSIAEQGYRQFLKVHKYVSESGLPDSLLHIIYLRVSQLNGCAFCVDMHYKDAVDCGVDPRKINCTVAWQDSPFFTSKERAALAWAESLTFIAATGAPSDVYRKVADEFDDKELADLSYAIALMNAFNRLSIGFRVQPPL